MTIVPAVTIDGTKYFTREIEGLRDSDIVDIELPNTVTRIGYNAFGNCRYLEKIRLPENVKTIDNNAFYECSSLSSVEFNDGLKTLGDNAFAHCSSLDSVELNEGLESLGGYAFYGCTALKTVEFKKGLKTIANSAFSSCSSLQSVKFNEEIESVGNFAFSGCTSLKSVDFNEGIKSLGESAFESCSKLSSIKIPNNVILKSRCFRNVPLKEIRLPQKFNIQQDELYSDSFIFNSNVLKNVYVESLTPQIPEGKSELLFDNSKIRDACLNVPKGSLDLYMKSGYWRSRFITIKEYDPE